MVQAIFHGVLVTIGAVAILGASGGATFVALVPVLSALFAIPLLGEWPNETDWVGIVLISAGVYQSSGGPLPSVKELESHHHEDEQSRSVGENRHNDSTER
jgi:hypothetical protein